MSLWLPTVACTHDGFMSLARSQIVAGMYQIHSNSCAHRDIKLENLLLTKDAQVRICDFGLAADARSKLDICCGSSNYVRASVRTV